MSTTWIVSVTDTTATITLTNLTPDGGTTSNRYLEFYVDNSAVPDGDDIVDLNNTLFINYTFTNLTANTYYQFLVKVYQLFSDDSTSFLYDVIGDFTTASSPTPPTPQPSGNGYVYICLETSPNTFKWKKAKPYIFDGTNWQPATAYIFNGLNWKKCDG